MCTYTPTNTPTLTTPSAGFNGSRQFSAACAVNAEIDSRPPPNPRSVLDTFSAEEFPYTRLLDPPTFEMCDFSRDDYEVAFAVWALVQEELNRQIGNDNWTPIDGTSPPPRDGAICPPAPRHQRRR